MLGAANLEELVGQGVAVIVGTRDAELRPAVARGWGPALSEDAATMIVCVEAPDGSTAGENLVAGQPLAVTLSRPTSYSTVQVKGTMVAVEAPSADDLERVQTHVQAFFAEVGKLGLAGDLARRLVGTELKSVVVEVTERYDQTPGPGAGRAL